MRILVVGAYGFIGQGIVRNAIANGHDVVGLGRDRDVAMRVLPGIAWLIEDLENLDTTAAWQPHLVGIEIVVNAAGVLQSSARDNVTAVQLQAIEALISACELAGVQRFIQISAPMAATNAPTEFMRTKGQADSLLRTSALAWTILRPGLVIGRDSYGGTALLRSLVSIPWVQPLVNPESRVHVVSLDDLVAVVGEAVEGRLGDHFEGDVVADESVSFRELFVHFRRWLGFGDPCWAIELPAWSTAVVARFADALGLLGWRSPMRSTAIRMMEDGISGDPRALANVSPVKIAPLSVLLQRQPATVQERWFARGYLCMPLVVATLALFWLVSGLIALVSLDAAVAVLNGVVPEILARVLVIGGALTDIALAVAVMMRRTARVACIGMILVTCVYLLSGTVLTPGLWLDPLGVFVKSIPAMLLAVVAMIWLQER